MRYRIIEKTPGIFHVQRRVLGVWFSLSRDTSEISAGQSLRILIDRRKFRPRVVDEWNVP